MKSMQLTIGLFILSLLSSFAQSSAELENYWPAWRGPLATGVSPNGNPPVTWSEVSNIKWKTSIPGKGHSTPVVWDNTVFVTTAVETQNSSGSAGTPLRFVVMAVNRTDGSILWERTVKEEVVMEQTHEHASFASNSPVTDGEHLYAYFGSRGLFCLDFQGNIIWERDFGHMQKRSDFGEGVAPALYGNRIVILWDHEGQSAIYCIDKNTGQDIWKMNRNEPSSWSTPLILEIDGKTQVITTAANRVRTYDLENGDAIWECAGLSNNVVPNPVFAEGILYAMSGHRGNALMAISVTGAQGNITGSDAVIWSSSSNTPYVPSPALVNGRLYFLRQNSGALSCLEATTGEVHYAGEMLDGLGVVYSSPVAAQDRLYVLGVTGLTYVIRQGNDLEILSQNKLDDSFTASPIIAGNELFIRGLKNLYCIAEE